MNDEHLEMDIKTIIIKHVKTGTKKQVTPHVAKFAEAQYIFNEKQFDDMALGLVGYINGQDF